MSCHFCCIFSNDTDNDILKKNLAVNDSLSLLPLSCLLNVLVDKNKYIYCLICCRELNILCYTILYIKYRMTTTLINHYVLVALLVNKPDKFRMKLCRSYSVVNKVGMLLNIINTQTKMYVCTLKNIYSSRCSHIAVHGWTEYTLEML